MRLGLALSALLMVASQAQAWGGPGHRIVAGLAERRLSPEARAALAELLPAGESLPQLALWADEYRERCRNTAPWHYLNLPLDAAQHDFEQVCPAATGCVVRAIEQALEVLADHTQPAEVRAFALKLVVHFVGDLHQPLHICARDRGGNDLKLIFRKREMSLHALWDHALIESTGQSEAAYTRRLARTLDRGVFSDVVRGGPFDWARQAQRGAAAAYAALPSTSTSSREAPLRVPASYARRMLPIVDRQLMQAAVRLARLLDDALTRAGPVVPAERVRALQACVAPEPSEH